ncbi:MAG: AMP-binding protein [Acidimicrobiales bacterium]
MSMTISHGDAGTALVVPGERTVDIADRVRRIAETDPTRVALIHAHRLPGGRLRYRRTTYADLSDRAERLAVGLRSVGIGEQTRCSFMVPPGFDAMALGLALWRVGAVVVGIEPHSHGLRRVGRSLAKADPEVFIGTLQAHAARRTFGWGSASVRRTILVSRVPLPGVVTTAALERCSVPTVPEASTIDPADPAVIAFTTGSTGAPKPTVLRQRNLAAMIDNVLGHWDLGEGRDVVDMPTFPMFWIIGLAAGGTVVVPPMDFALHGPGDADPALLLRTIRDCGVRSMFASPALLTNLGGCRRPRRRSDRCAAHRGRWREVLVTVVRRRAVGAGARRRAVLGPSRGDRSPARQRRSPAPRSSPTPGRAPSKGAGVCVAGRCPTSRCGSSASTTARLRAGDDARPLPAGAIGEVVARGPHISEGYDCQPQGRRREQDRRRRRADLAPPGDTGYLDAGGRLWVCGRRSHRVVVDEHTTVFLLCCEPVANAVAGVARSALVALEGADGKTRRRCCASSRWTPRAIDHAGPRGAGPVGAGRRRPLRAGWRSWIGCRSTDGHNAKLDRPRIAAIVAALPPEAILERPVAGDGAP